MKNWIYFPHKSEGDHPRFVNMNHVTHFRKGQRADLYTIIFDFIDQERQEIFFDEYIDRENAFNNILSLMNRI